MKSESGTLFALYAVCVMTVLELWICKRDYAPRRAQASYPQAGLAPFEVCVLTARRPENASYVEGALRSLEREGVSMRDVTVVDTDGEARARLGDFGEAKVPPLLDRRRLADCVDDGRDVSSGVPCRVLQSNYDVSMALSLCESAARAAGKDWILVMEDDVEACEGSMEAISARLREAQGEPSTCLVNFSKFSRGYALRARHALDLMAEIRAKASETPYDHVLMRGSWPGAAARAVHGQNQFHHVGEVSTVLYRNEQGYRGEFGAMRSDVCGEPL